MLLLCIDHVPQDQHRKFLTNDPERIVYRIFSAPSGVQAELVNKAIRVSPQVFDKIRGT
jgi:hypothetical protein